jgi:NAD+ kinase
VSFGRVALVVHPTRPVDGALGTLTRWTAERGLPLVQLGNRGETRRQVAEPATVAPGDLVMALGGDGTVLSVFDGDWTPRPVPALAIAGGERAVFDRALNDFVVVRLGAGQLGVAVTVDDELYVRFTGDGLIVATALGSSAYSMAAGEPLLAGGTPAYLCTPLAMHGGNAPPLAVPAEAALTVEVMPGHAGFAVEIDGFRTDDQSRGFRLTLEPDVATLVDLGPAGHGLAALRRRRLVSDSPRMLARDERRR